MTAKWSAFLVVSIGTLLGTIDHSGINVALPTFARIFEALPETVLWVMLAHGLVYTGFTLTAGRLADMFGRRRVYTLGLVVLTVGLTLSSLAQGLWQLVAYRAIQGFGAALLVSNSSAIVAAAFPGEERGKGLGLLEAVVGVGLMTGPVVAGVLLDWLDWRAIFYVRIPVALGAIVLAVRLLMEPGGAGGQRRFDLPGAATLFAGLTCLIVAINQGPRAGWGSPWIVVLLAASAVFLALFVAVEARGSEPVMDLGLFKRRAFSTYMAVLLAYFVPIGAVLFLLPFHLTHGLGYTASAVGLFLTVWPLLLLLVSPVSGTLSDRIGSRTMVTVGITAALAGLLLLSRLPTDGSAILIVTAMAMLGVAAGLLLTPSYSAIMGATPAGRLGTAAALIATVRNVGLALGQASAATVYAVRRAAHEVSLPAGLESLDRGRLALTLGFQDAVLAAAAVALVGVLIILAFGRQ